VKLGNKLQANDVVYGKMSTVGNGTVPIAVWWGGSVRATVSIIYKNHV